MYNLLQTILKSKVFSNIIFAITIKLITIIDKALTGPITIDFKYGHGGVQYVNKRNYHRHRHHD